MAVASAVLRIWLDAGHGLGNSRPGVFDTGATSACGSEHEIAYRIVDLVADRFYRDPEAPLTVAETPSCSTACAAKHKKRGHLAYKIDYINDNLKRRPDGRSFGEVVLSLHLNSSSNPSTSGVEVLYSHSVPARRRVAAAIAEAVAATLGLPNRGAKSDRDSSRGSIAILNRTECPAYLIEMGFVTNPEDVLRVRECGVDALIAAISVIAKEHGQ